MPETQTIEGLSAALRAEPEAFYRTVLESLSEAVILIDADHRIFYANRLAVDITGYSPEELLGQVGYELLLPDGQPPRPDCSSTHPLLGKTECFEVEIKRKDGQLHWVHVQTTPYRNDQGEIGGTVLGESGTGKELVARAIHDLSARKDHPLVRVNCASIPKELFESEFFGHVRGAFTGAIKDRVGRFELADGGTLFLDEIGEIPLDLQSKLLRVLQEGQFERVGDERTRSTKVRLIVATNRDLLAEAKTGHFRLALYYRLSVFPIEVPSLRERLEDVGELAEHFIKQASRRLGVPRPRLTKIQAQELQNYDWPGNVR